MPQANKPSDLNDNQWKAVQHSGRCLLIVAGPGTGKTHTLTSRIAYVRNQSAQKILAVTFTNKAAVEMRERLLRRFSISADDNLFVGTFHAYCLRFLRQQRSNNFSTDFQFPSEWQKEELIQQLWPEKTLSQRREILKEISLEKGRAVAPLSESRRTYDEALRQNKWLDFDDLLTETLKILQDDPSILNDTRQNLGHVFVDEFQDINPVQKMFLGILVGNKEGHVHLTSIGDPNQSIYGFRGAHADFFQSFQKDFPDSQVVYLNENYRSSEALLKASSQLIQKSFFKVPPLTARIYSEGKLCVHECSTDAAEAEYVVHQIEKLVGGTSLFSRDSGRVKDEEERSYSFGDFAVLFRLHQQGDLLKEAFERSGIPFQIRTKDLRNLKGFAEWTQFLKTQDPQREDLPNLIESSLKKYFPVEEIRRDVWSEISALAKNALSLQDFLDQIFLCEPEDQIQFNVEKVNLLSLHASKGLEFPVVFIVGCEENLLPLKIEGLLTDEQEERRLFYVGMTRAKERLILCSAKRRQLFGKALENPPLSFLTDIENDLKEQTQSLRPKIRREKQFSLFD